MADDCAMCRRIPKLTPENPYFIAELATGYAVLAANQYYRGYTIFLAKQCVPELHELQPGVRSQFLEDMATVAEAMFRAFAPRKLNYELLGNSVTHLHWHLFPRYADDPNPRRPVWENPAFSQADGRAAPDAERIRELRDDARRALADVRGRA